MLKSIAADEEQPMMLRIMAKRMLSNKAFEVLEKILDRIHGKASQTDYQKGRLDIGLADFLRDDLEPVKQRSEV